MNDAGKAPGPAGGDDGKLRRLPVVAKAIPLLALFALLGWVGWNGLKTDSGSSSGPAVGTQIPPFAAPIAASGLEGDVNVARGPNEGAAGSQPACEVTGSDVLNSCELVERSPAALAFITAGEGRCADAFDRLARQARGTGVRVAAVIVRGSREEARSLVARRHWGEQVAWDRDGVLANLYGVAVCPQVVYLERGGLVASVGIGNASPRRIRAELESLGGADR